MKGRDQLMGKVAELYAEIFKEKPWVENFQPDEVMKFMIEQFYKPRTVIALAAVKNRKVVGFSWMYEIFEDDLKEDTRYSSELGFLFEGQKRVFYLQEIGVKKELRRQDIGEKLAHKILKKAKAKGANFIVLSTNSKARSAQSLFSKVGFQNSGIVRPPKELGRAYWTLQLGN